MINAVNRDIPEYIEGYGKVKPFKGAFANINEAVKKGNVIKCKGKGENKVVDSIEQVLKLCGIRDGMTLSFHHHLRNGDYVLNMVMKEVERLGIKDIKVAASSIFPIHEPLVDLIKKGVVTGIYTNYMSGPVAEAVSLGYLKYPVVMHTHGGRARAIESGDLHIDIAFIAAPSCDFYGNIMV